MLEFIVNPSDIMVKFTAPEDRVVHGPSMVIDGVIDGVTDAERKILDVLRIDSGYSYVMIAKSLWYVLLTGII